MPGETEDNKRGSTVHYHTEDKKDHDYVTGSRLPGIFGMKHATIRKRSDPPFHGGQPDGKIDKIQDEGQAVTALTRRIKKGGHRVQGHLVTRWTKGTVTDPRRSRHAEQAPVSR